MSDEGEVFMVTRRDAELAFQLWAKRVWDGCGEPLTIHRIDAGRAADGFLGAIQEVRKGWKP